MRTITLQYPLFYISVLCCFFILPAACDSTKKPSQDFLQADSTLIKLLKLQYQNPDSTQKECYTLLQQAQDKKLNNIIAGCYLLLGSIQEIKGNYDSSIHLLDKAFVHIDTTKQYGLSAEYYNQLGICYDYTSNYKKALDNYNKALFYFELNNNKSGAIKVKNNIGLIYQSTSEYKRAAQIFKDCLAKAKELNDTSLMIMVVSNLASVQLETGEEKDALNNFKIILAEDIKSGAELYISYSYNNIAQAHKVLKNYDSAELYYNKAIAIKEKLHAEVALLNSYKEYAELQLVQNNLLTAEQYLNKAFELAQKNKTIDYLTQCYLIQSRIDSAKGEFKSALANFKRYDFLNDSIAGAKYNTELVAKEKDNQIQLKNAALNQLNKDALYNKRLILLLSCLLLVVLTAGFFMVRFIRTIKKQNALLKINKQKQDLYIHQINQSKKQLEDELSRKNKFLSFLAHEIRNPLGGIIGLHNLLAETNTTEEQKEYIQYLQTSSNQLLHLLDDVLSYHKLIYGNVALVNNTFSIYEVITQVNTLYSGQLKQKEINFVTHYDYNIPSNIKGDSIKLYQVIGNLVNNAIKFTPQEGSITISAQLLSRDDKYCTVNFYVKDSGIGIAPNDQSIIFDFYQQTESSKQTGKGIGLGLSIVKELLLVMNSKIQLTSNYGQGSTFSFEVNFEIA
jgi:signal transduction histidine kinase